MLKLVPVLLALTLGACASQPVTTSRAPAPTPAPPAASQPTPTPAPAPAPAPATPRVPVPAEAPANWQHLDAAADGVIGVSARRAERELLAGRQPQRTVVVAVIDGGVDTAHVALRGNLWTNAREVAGNGRDDDNNGYADDTRGWNFIGGADGKDVDWDTLELTRLHARCTGAAAAPGTAPNPADSLSPEERARCPELAREFEAKRRELQGQLQQITTIEGMFDQATRVLAGALGSDSVTPARVEALRPASDQVRSARQLYLRMAASGITQHAIEEAKKDVNGRLQYGLNLAFDPRPVVGDDPHNLAQRAYGNRNVMGPDASHGSHVAGIIGAARGVGEVEGLAPAVRIMSVRTVPNGDERDKDVANAIRYAVDNGAHIINMSFGKDLSPNKAAVDEAVRYADGKGVLLVHAAGNDGEDLATSPSFPTPTYLGGGRAQNWIEVGASSWRGANSLAAPFSNYGKAQVDVFAPGVDILSTVPGGGYERNSGTSMAAPVVSGVAALLMSHFPRLTAADVKRLILETATRYADTMVARPGATGGEQIPFGALSATGGVVNAYEAVKKALAESGSTQ